MNKIVFFVMLMFLVSCGGKEAVQSEVQSESVPAVSEGAPVPVEKKVVEVPKDESSDLASWIASKVPVKCVSEKDGVTATVYFVGQKVRMDTMPVDAHAIYDDERMWAWSGKVGTTMSMNDIKKLAQMSGQKLESKDDIVQKYQDPGINCERASVPDNAFTPPSDVKFQDMSELLKSQLGTPI